jgi:hypothetical protein
VQNRANDLPTIWLPKCAPVSFPAASALASVMPDYVLYQALRSTQYPNTAIGFWRPPAHCGILRIVE